MTSLLTFLYDVNGLESSEHGASSSAVCCQSALSAADKRDVAVTGRLRHARTFEPLKSRTVKFRNFDTLILYFWTVIFRLFIRLLGF